MRGVKVRAAGRYYVRRRQYGRVAKKVGRTICARWVRHIDAIIMPLFSLHYLPLFIAMLMFAAAAISALMMPPSSSDFFDFHYCLMLSFASFIISYAAAIDVCWCYGYTPWYYARDVYLCAIFCATCFAAPRAMPLSCLFDACHAIRLMVTYASDADAMQLHCHYIDAEARDAYAAADCLLCLRRCYHFDAALITAYIILRLSMPLLMFSLFSFHIASMLLHAFHAPLIFSSFRLLLLRLIFLDYLHFRHADVVMQLHAHADSAPTRLLPAARFRALSFDAAISISLMPPLTMPSFTPWRYVAAFDYCRCTTLSADTFRRRYAFFCLSFFALLPFSIFALYFLMTCFFALMMPLPPFSLFLHFRHFRCIAFDAIAIFFAIIIILFSPDAIFHYFHYSLMIFFPSIFHWFLLLYFVMLSCLRLIILLLLVYYYIIIMLSLFSATLLCFYYFIMPILCRYYFRFHIIFIISLYYCYISFIIYYVAITMIISFCCRRFYAVFIFFIFASFLFISFYFHFFIRAIFILFYLWLFILSYYFIFFRLLLFIIILFHDIIYIYYLYFHYYFRHYFYLFIFIDIIFIILLSITLIFLLISFIYFRFIYFIFYYYYWWLHLFSIIMLSFSLLLPPLIDFHYDILFSLMLIDFLYCQDAWLFYFHSLLFSLFRLFHCRLLLTFYCRFFLPRYYISIIYCCIDTLFIHFLFIFHYYAIFSFYLLFTLTLLYAILYYFIAYFDAYAAV